MLWRILSVVIVLFWAVMTGLIIRDTYFPDYSRFAIVPPRFVFDLFLSEAAAFNNTLHLYHDRTRIGHTTFSIRKDGAEGEAPPVYALLASGMVTLAGPTGLEQDLNFRVTAELADAERWHHLDVELKSRSADLSAVILWKEGDSMPQVEVKKGGQLVMNTEMMQTMMAMKGIFSGGFEWLSELKVTKETAGISPLQAREGIMDLAGKRRRCYIVTWTFLQTEEIRIYFTEVGELARIELPQGYRFIEPMMHGLEKGIDTTE